MVLDHRHMLLNTVMHIVSLVTASVLVDGSNLHHWSISDYNWGVDYRMLDDFDRCSTVCDRHCDVFRNRNVWVFDYHRVLWNRGMVDNLPSRRIDPWIWGSLRLYSHWSLSRSDRGNTPWVGNYPHWSDTSWILNHLYWSNWSVTSITHRSCAIMSNYSSTHYWCLRSSYCFRSSWESCTVLCQHIFILHLTLIMMMDIFRSWSIADNSSKCIPDWFIVCCLIITMDPDSLALAKSTHSATTCAPSPTCHLCILAKNLAW